jgi:hypothetical protein
MTILQEWMGRFSLPSSSFALDDNGGNTPTITIPAAKYFIAGYTSEASLQLVEKITALMQLETGFTNATCTYDETTGKAKFAFPDSASDLTWTETAIRDILGYTADLVSVGAGGQVADNEARYNWRPDRCLSGYPVQMHRLLQPRSSTRGGRSNDGTVWSIVGNIVYDAELEYRLLDVTRAYIPAAASVDWRSFEYFFEDVAHKGEQIRLFPDRTLRTVSDYTSVMAATDETLGAFDDFSRRRYKNSNGLWNIDIPIWKYV